MLVFIIFYHSKSFTFYKTIKSKTSVNTKNILILQIFQILLNILKIQNDIKEF
jgi:hypothetical protein